MRKAIFPGSFDPFTIGHDDIVQRGLQLFDHITIGIGRNAEKKSTFSVEERIQAIQTLYQDNPRVTVQAYDGLTVHWAKEIGATFVLRGVRSIQDYDYERAMADANRQLAGIETVLLYTKPEYAHISSTLVRDLYRHHQDISTFLPQRNTK